MDWVGIGGRAAGFFKKYRYVILVLAAGLVLMALPEGKTGKEEPAPEAAEPANAAPELQDALADILSHVEGAGRVRVLLTQAQGEQTLYQTDEDISADDSSSDIRRETVLIQDSQRAESGLVRQVNPPVYQGAIVLCQGADSAAVRLAIVEAVANATGLTSDKISVLKMK